VRSVGADVSTYLLKVDDTGASEDLVKPPAKS
jgi:hypothetical protein